MKSQDEAYVRYRLVQARETLTAAQLLFENGLLRSAVNRLYYACFYVAEALLRTEGMHATTHRGVMSLLDIYWAKTGRISAEMASFYNEVFKERHEGDYVALTAFVLDDVRDWLRNAKSFVDFGTEIAEKALSSQ
jgi:hypothetical protein